LEDGGFFKKRPPWRVGILVALGGLGNGLSLKLTGWLIKKADNSLKVVSAS